LKWDSKIYGIDIKAMADEHEALIGLSGSILVRSIVANSLYSAAC
jgi:hypothetical protein